MPDEFVGMLDFRHGETEVLNAGFTFFLEDLKMENDISQIDGEWMQEEFKWNPYPKAVKKYGALEYDECFGYLPLLGMGGSEKVEKLKKVKLYEHIGINIGLLGPLI
jgi:hypothetical protein